MRKIPERMVPVDENEWLKQRHMPLYKLVLPYIKGKTVLDAGCGCGLGSSIWINNGAKTVYAYDISDEALNFSYKNYQKNDMIIFNKINFNYDKLPKEFVDVACSIEVIEHIENYEFYIQNIYNSLKKDGILFLTTPNAELSSGDNEFHVHEFVLSEMEQLLFNYNFKILHRCGVSTDHLSKTVYKYTPDLLINLFKKMPLYSTIVAALCKPKIDRSENNETMIFIAKKI